MGNLCYCCLDEGAKVGRVLDKFMPLPVSQAQDGALQKLVGRVVLAGQQPFYTPATNTPCVYYHILVEEEHREYYTDQEGRRQERLTWKTIVNEEQFVDFYLQDGVNKCFVKGSDRGSCRIQSQKSGGRTNFFNQPPMGVQMLINMRQQGFGWGMFGSRTGRFRYTESSFDVNELVAALGVVTPAMDPYTGQPVKILNPFNKETLTEAYMTQNQWSDWDKKAWTDLVARPAVLLSDDPKFTGTVQVAQVMNLPVYMTQYVAPDPNYNMYGGGVAYQAAPAPGAGY